MAKKNMGTSNNTWREVKNVWVRIGGVWRDNVIPRGRVNGAWKEFMLYVLTNVRELWKYSSKNATSTITTISFHEDGYIYYGTNSGYVGKLDMSGGLIWEVRFSTAGRITSISDRENGNYLHVGAENGYILVNTEDGSMFDQYTAAIDHVYYTEYRNTSGSYHYVNMVYRSGDTVRMGVVRVFSHTIYIDSYVTLSRRYPDVVKKSTVKESGKDVFYILSSDNSLIKTTDINQVWEVDISNIIGLVVGEDGVPYLISNDKKLLQIDPRSGEVSNTVSMTNLPYTSFRDGFVAKSEGGALYIYGVGNSTILFKFGSNNELVWEKDISTFINDAISINDDYKIAVGSDSFSLKILENY